LSQTSLLCNIYVDAKLQLPVPLQSELLQAAAFAISASLAGYNKKNSDIGVRLILRLLLPFAEPSADVSIVATLGESLERHTPGNDSEARALISLCQPLVERKSVRVLDGCVSLVLSRYRSHLADRRPGGAMYWLLMGIDLESMHCLDEDCDVKDWQSIEAVSVCYRHLATWCNNVAASFLRDMQDEKEGFGLYYQTAQEIVKSVKEGPLQTYSTKLPEVRTLELVLGVYDGMTNKDNWTAAAECIVECLEERGNEYDDGVVSAVAPRSMHWDLLQLGLLILEADEKRETEVRMGEFAPSFDVKGVRVLMEHLRTTMWNRELEGLKPLHADVVQKMRLALGIALKRAFVAENARRKKGNDLDWGEAFISQIRSADLHKHSLATQEQVVQNMLDI